MQKNIYGAYYPVEYFNPHVHLEYDYNNISELNEAEMKALQHEEYKNKYDERQKLKNMEFTNKYNKNVLLYKEEQKMRNKEKEMNKNKEKSEKILKKQNFIKSVYEKNMKPNQKPKSTNKILKNNKNKEIKQEIKQEIKIINHNNENNIFDDDDFDNDRFIRKKTILKEINNKLSMDDSDRNDENITLDKDKNDTNDNLNNNIVDLRGNIEEILLEEIKTKQKYNKNNELKDQINEKMSNLKRFRSYGFLPPQDNDIIENKKKKKIKKKKFFSEFEKRRFIKALKHIITERLGEHNIYIQNICNCGNLQKQLTALVEKGNLTVYALTEVECANNCVFYNNKKAYLKCINDVLNSIKDISYENFHNKYKD